jgi:putative DNA-invertase from lambdoid prophage Rac
MRVPAPWHKSIGLCHTPDAPDTSLISFNGDGLNIEGLCAMSPKVEVRRVALYARVSTSDQRTNAAQIEALREYAARRGWEVVHAVAEVGSGAKTRPKREALLKAIRRREVDAVLVYKLDRWGRSLADLVNTLQELAELGIAFVSLSDAIDMSTPSGRAFAGMLSVFASFERDLISDRVRGGLERARKAGTKFGRPAPSRAGWPAQAHAERIRELAAEGVSKRGIATKLGLHRTSVRRVLEAARHK